MDFSLRARIIWTTLNGLFVVGVAIAHAFGCTPKIVDMIPVVVLSGIFGALCCALVFQVGLLLLALYRQKVARAEESLVPSKRGTYKVVQYWDRKGGIFMNPLDSMVHPHPKVVRYENGDYEHWKHPDSNHPSWLPREQDTLYAPMRSAPD